MISRAFGTLRFRLAVTLLLGFLLLGGMAILLIVWLSLNYQQQVTQSMHRDLAAHVVDHYLLYNEGRPDLKEAKQTFHDLMILGPNFEFYVLDSAGKILAYSTDPDKIKREAINLSDIQQFLNTQQLENTITGDDPRGIDRRKIFSVAPILNKSEESDDPIGYLYVILGSEIFDQVSDLVIESKIIQWGLWIFLLGMLGSLLLTLWLTGLVTRPLIKLTHQVRAVQASGFSRERLLKKGGQSSQLEALSVMDALAPTEINTLRSAFVQSLEKLSEQYENVVTIDELRKDLLSHVSHDLRTPLAALLGYLETWEINQDKLTPEQSRQYIGTAKKSAERVSSLVEQLFELAHLDSDNVQVHIEPFAIAELVEDVLQKFRLSAQQKKISLSVTPQDSGIKVRGDIEKLDRVFTNLVENALRHTPEGGAITVRLKDGSRLVSVEVADTGIGIPDEDLPHIFDPHYKAGNSVRENTAHGGLGLAITKRLLELHQSNISVDSRINGGTTFQFALLAS